jgi:glycosyltransferase involved in cell wall biosynthesis
MGKKMNVPDYIFESSWEVCNKVGGIYTVLSTRAKTLQDVLKDRVFFIGPDCWSVDNVCPYFTEDFDLFSDWRLKAHEKGIDVRIGRWNIPGNPIVILVKFTSYYHIKNDIYGKLWEYYHVDSLHAYGDYDEASMFSFAAGKVVESFYKYNIKESEKVIYQGNEWMTGLGLLYVNHNLPQIATIFTTHATSIGRSIAGNNKPLYEYLWAYNGDQMAYELNMQSKHSIEKQTAKYVDCFTTVSDITAKESKELLDKAVDFVLPNGFDDDFVPTGAEYTSRRKQARKRLLNVANALTGDKFDDETVIISTSGRYEFRNKGIDVYIDAINSLRAENLTKKIVAFIEVPGWVSEPRKDLQNRLNSGKIFDTPLDNPEITHWLHNMDNDNVLCMMKRLGIDNLISDSVKLIFIPCYLTGDDGIVNMAYYDVVLGNDLCIYPSYYEPWGYTPLEAIAFKVPCITTDLAGFGLWANSVKGSCSCLEDGVEVIHRTDYNYSQVVDDIKNTIYRFTMMPEPEVKIIRARTQELSKKALWKEFINYYYAAYDFALQRVVKRV